MKLAVSRPRPRTLIAAGAALVLAAAAVIWFVVIRPSSAQGAQAQSQTLTATVEATTIEQSVTASGTLTPAVDEAVSFSAAGTVTAVKVEEGDTVEKGQTLATIDTLQLDAALASAKYDLEAADAALAEAEDADDDSDAADALVEAREAALDVAQSAYDDAEDAMSYATLVAPAAGLITSVDLAVGDVVGSSSSQSGSGATGMTGTTDTSTAGTITIVGTGSWSVPVSVSETDLASIEVGDQVEMTSDSLTDTLFGVVSEIGRLPSTDSGSVTYPVTIEVTGDADGLYDGVSVDASIIYSRRTDVLTVPSAAVTRADDGTATVDVVGGDGELTTTTVELGETSGSSVEVTSGLAEGDEVSYTIAIATQDGDDEQQGGEMPSFPGGGEMPSFPGGDGQIPGGGQMPGGGGQG